MKSKMDQIAIGTLRFLFVLLVFGGLLIAGGETNPWNPLINIGGLLISIAGGFFLYLCSKSK